MLESSSIDVRKNVSYYNGEVVNMEKIINITNLRKDLYKICESIIKDGLVANVSTKSGNIIMISKDEYDSILETLYLSANPEVKKSLLEGKDIPEEECINEKDVKW